MTVKRARIVFAVLMQAAREGKHLTAYDKQQLNRARQVLRQIRKPVMNPRGGQYTTMAEAKQIAKKYGFTIKRTDYDEYRVCLIGGNEDSASYESDIDAAIGTGIAMAKYSVTRFPKGYAKQIKSNPRHTQSIKADHADVFIHNPKATLIYGKVNRIIATKTQKHICDAECKKHGHRYYHDFSSQAQMYGLPDGSLLIKSR